MLELLLVLELLLELLDDRLFVQQLHLTEKQAPKWIEEFFILSPIFLARFSVLDGGATEK